MKKKPQKKGKAQTIEQYLDRYGFDKFFDFSSGVPIGDDEIKERIIRIIKILRRDKKSMSYSIGSGNTEVSIYYDASEERADICINKNYKEGHIYFIDAGIIDLGGIPLKKDPKANKWYLNYKIKWDD